MATFTSRPHIQLRTAQLKELVESSAHDCDILHTIYVELLFREKRAAKELREQVSESLKVLSTKYFVWPSTDAQLGDGQIDDSYFQYHQGLLGFMGYRVGESGIGQTQRHDLLDAVYSGRLPTLNSKEYMSEWGEPSTGQRLKKVAESIAAFVRNAKRRNPQRMSLAISEWESDLSYMKERYYRHSLNFIWPNAET